MSQGPTGDQESLQLVLVPWLVWSPQHALMGEAAPALLLPAEQAGRG